MDEGRSFEVIVRRMAHSNTEERLYRVTIFRKIEGLDELLGHPEIAPLIGQSVTRVEKIDNFRFNIFVNKGEV